MNKLQHIWIPLLGMILFSCTGRETAQEAESSAVKSWEAEIPRIKNQINVALAQKKSWLQHWGAVVGQFDAEDFELFHADSIGYDEMPEQNPILPNDPLFPYQFPHPEDKGTMDIYSYKVKAHENLEKPFLNPDSEVIWYKNDGMKERLLFMGPSGMFEDGMWVSSSEFLVMGYFEEEIGYRPMVWMIDVGNRRFFQFQLTHTSKEYEIDSYLAQKLKNIKFS